MISKKSITVQDQLLQLAAYNIYSDELPDSLGKPLKNYLALLNQSLASARPMTISTVVATHYYDKQSPIAGPSKINLYTFGSFRSYYSAITKLAKALTSLYAEIHVLPIIYPITISDWDVITREKRLPYRRIFTEGIITYVEHD